MTTRMTVFASVFVAAAAALWLRGTENEQPVALAGATSEYPNRPAGLALIGSFNGSVKQADGHAFGIAGFSDWYDHNKPSDIAVVSDPTNPTGSGRSLRFTYPSDDNKAGSTTANRFPGGPYRELYIMTRVFMERSGWDRFGSKFFYLGAATGARRGASKPTQYYVDRSSVGRLRVINQHNRPPVLIASLENPPTGSRSTPIAQGVWLNVEYLLTAESAPGAGDGRVSVWVNNKLVGTNSAVSWTSKQDRDVGFDGMEWYGEVNSIPATSYYRLGELYLAGKK